MVVCFLGMNFIFRWMCSVSVDFLCEGACSGKWVCIWYGEAVNLSDFANSSYCFTGWCFISSVGVLGVGVNDNPFMSSCVSCALNLCLLKLCIPISALLEALGLALKKNQVSFVLLLMELGCYLSFFC